MQFSQEESVALAKIDFQKFVSRLRFAEALVFHLLTTGMQVQEIARQHQCSRRTVARTIAGIRRKFDDFFMSHIIE